MTFDSPNPVRDAAHAEKCGCALPGCEFVQGWNAAIEFALERLGTVQEVLPHCDGPGDVAEEMKALHRRLQRTTGSA